MKGHYKNLLETINSTQCSQRRNMPRFERLGLLMEASLAAGDYDRACKLHQSLDNEIQRIRVNASQQYTRLNALKLLEGKGFSRQEAQGLIESYPWVGDRAARIIANSAVSVKHEGLLVAAAILPVSSGVALSPVKTPFIIVGEPEELGGKFEEAKIIGIKTSSQYIELTNVREISIGKVHVMPSGNEGPAGVELEVSLSMENGKEYKGSLEMHLGKAAPFFDYHSDRCWLEVQ